MVSNDDKNEMKQPLKEQSAVKENAAKKNFISPILFFCSILSSVAFYFFCPTNGFVHVITPTTSSEHDFGLDTLNKDTKKSCFLQHLTVLVSDLDQAKAWYEKALPLVQIERNIQTAIRGAWYYLNGIELHLLEKKELIGDTDGGRITGQHIGLNLGPIGETRDELYRKGIAATLAPDNSKGQQAMFVTDADLMTWEFTAFTDKQKPMELTQSETTLHAGITNIPLNRPAASRTEDSTTEDKPFKFAISCGNPIAASAGHAILQMGGSAADATIATAAVLSVVEPFNGGLGGDFIAMLHNPRDDKYSVLNGSGRSPKNVKPLSESDKIPLDGALSAMSVPGTAAAWCKLHSEYGKLPWKLILEPAIMLASEGFLVSDRGAQVWESGAKRIMNSSLNKSAKDEFLSMFAPPASNGKRMTPRVGERFYNPTLGSTYQMFADGGCEWFYNDAAKDIAAQVQHHGGFKGSPDLTEDWKETADDHAAWETPLSTTYSSNGQNYEVLTAGGNSQAGAALMILNALNATLADVDPKNFNEVLHKHISAKRVVYRDTFRQPYTQELIGNNYYTETARQEIEDAFLKKTAVSMDRSPIEQAHDTEGFVVRDSDGLTLSVLQSIALPFGSGVIVPSLGIPIHNRGYGFTTNPSDKYCFGPGKRPWTTLAPYLVKRNGNFWMAASVKGGDRQPYAFTQVFLNVAHHQLTPEDAVSYPRFRDKTHTLRDSILEFDLPPYVPTDTHLNVSQFDQLRSDLHSNGYLNNICKPKGIEDSGFGLAQILIDESVYSADGSHLSTQYTVASDVGRKPGLAITGEQSQLKQAVSLTVHEDVVHPRDLHMLTIPLKNYYLNDMMNLKKTAQ